MNQVSTKLKLRIEFLRGEDGKTKRNPRVKSRFLITQVPQITILNRIQNKPQFFFRWKPRVREQVFSYHDHPAPPFTADDLDGEMSSWCPSGDSRAALRLSRLANSHFHAHSLHPFRISGWLWLLRLMVPWEFEAALLHSVSVTYFVYRVRPLSTCV